MPSSTVSRIVLRDYIPAGTISLSDFELQVIPAPTKDQLQQDQVIIKPTHLSIDPYIRGRMSGVTDSYVPSFVKGEPISNFLVATVTASASPHYKVGDSVLVNDGKWQTEYIADSKDVIKITPRDGVSPKDYLGILGMSPFTAYYGTVIVGKIKAGETILVSSASGAVGQMVVQIAKIKGLRVIAVAGSDEKADYVKQLGADAAINYKTCGNYFEAIKKAAPGGIDIYYDNVGGEFLEAALANLKNYGRVVICGATTQYNNDSSYEGYGIKTMPNILVRRATVTGFIILDHLNTPVNEQFFDEFSQLYREGKITYKIDESHGFENATKIVLDQLSGKNVGKCIVTI